MIVSLVFLILAYLIVVSLLSARLAGGKSPYTRWGWFCTAIYALYVLASRPGSFLPLHGEYVFLILLSIAFVVASIKDEAQPEPWWWPTKLGLTRAERSATPRGRH